MRGAWRRLLQARFLLLLLLFFTRVKRWTRSRANSVLSLSAHLSLSLHGRNPEFAMPRGRNIIKAWVFLRHWSVCTNRTSCPGLVVVVVVVIVVVAAALFYRLVTL